MENIKIKMIEVLNLIGEDIEDRKISEVEIIYNKVSEIKDELRNIVSPRVNEQKRCNIIAKNIIDYFEEWLPNYKIDLRKVELLLINFFTFYFCVYYYSIWTLSHHNICQHMF